MVFWPQAIIASSPRWPWVGILLRGRRLSTRSLLGEVDGPLLVMIAALFVITGAVTALPATAHVTRWLAAHGLLPFHIG